MSRLFVIFQHILPQHGLSKFVAWIAARPWLKKRLIGAFIRRYGVDMSESLIENPDQFRDFNDFFTRQLKPTARPLCEEIGALLSPCDGSISQVGQIQRRNLLQAKGRSYSLSALLGGDESMVEHFSNGTFVTIYLSPRDYHRVHMPLAGSLIHSHYIPGSLFSVNPATVAGVKNLFARNERLLCFFDTQIGPIAIILVGAMIVSGIETVWSGPVGSKTPTENEAVNLPVVKLAAGEEMGRFRLGSTVILLFAPRAVELAARLAAQEKVQMGSSLGRIRATA